MDSQNKAPSQRLALWTCVVVMAATVVAAGIAAAPRPAPRFHGTTYTEAAPAADFALTDHDGRAVSLRSYRGAPVLLFFGYTHCPDVCPLTLDRLTRALRSAGDVAKDVRILLVTLDPARDTPAALKTYAARFGPAVIGLTGDSAGLAKARAGYGAYVADVPAQPAAGHAHEGHGAPPASTVQALKTVHSGVVYGIDRRGNLQVVITEGAPVEQVADDVRTLARL
ncbi:MAG TPA: SCO family protein [Longimicrobium sp.]|jgi:protein SCO1/2|uniref:SCO family protein n=1 Tax=Longimicrobium sp. TaxID=2029185 RepID=UPI002EDA9FC3